MAVPVLTSLTPLSGPTAGGTVVALVGSGLDTVTAVDFGATPAADFAVLSATRLAAVSPAGTGTAALTVTNPDGESNAVGFSFSDGLFSVAEARAFTARGVLPLVDDALYLDAVITAREVEIRELFEQSCGVAFIPTTVTAEAYDGVCSPVLRLRHKNPALESPRRALTVTAAAVDGVALTVAQLAALKAHPDGRLVRTDGATWSSGTGYQDLAVTVTYKHGWAAVPAQIKTAALQLLVRRLVGSDVPEEAVSFTDGGASYQFPRPGQAPHWTGYDAVDAVLRAFQENRAVIA